MVETSRASFIECVPSDYIDFVQNQTMWKLIDEDECLLFADKVKKFNQFKWRQERIILITSESIYNVKKDKIKRCIKIDKLAGLSKSLRGS